MIFRPRLPADASWHWLALVGIWLAMFGGLIFDDKLIPYDSKDAFYPYAAFVVHSLQHGDLPFWNPYFWGGMSSIGDPQGLNFAPTLIAPFLLLHLTPRAFDVVVALHLLLGSWFFFRFLRTWHLSPGAAMVGAVVFAYGGPLVLRLQHTPMILSHACLAAVLYFGERLLRSPRPTAALGLGISAGLMAAMPNQVSFLGLLTACAYLLLRLATVLRESEAADRRPLLGWLGAAGVLGVLMALPQLLATLGFLPMSNRPDFAYQNATVGSIQPFGFITLFATNFLGNLAGTYSGPADVTETYLGIGAAAFVLVLLRWVARSPWNFLDRFFSTLAVLAAGYVLGHNTPVHRFYFDWLPGVSLFRRPSDASFALMVAMAVLAARGTQLAAASGERRPSINVWAGAAVALTVLLLTAMGLRQAYQSGQQAQALAALWPAAVFALATWAAWRWRTRGAWLLVVLVLSNLFVFGRNSHHALSRHEPEAVAVMRKPRAYPLVQRLAGDTGPGQFRVELQQRFGWPMWDNLPMAAGLQGVLGNGPIVYASYMRTLGAGPGHLLHDFNSSLADSYDSSLMDFFGVRYLLTKNPQPAPGNKWLPLGEESGMFLWRNDHALPKLGNPRQMAYFESGRMTSAGDINQLDLSHYVVFEAADKEKAEAMGCGNGAGHFVLGRYRNTHIEVETTADVAAWLTINDVFDPAWQASVDGRPLPVLRVNGSFRGICVPAGKHVLRMDYRPFAWLGARP